jgi:4-hydroxybenzoate polyprenyltransferase
MTLIPLVDEQPLPATPRDSNRALAFWRILHPLPSLLTVLASGAFVLLAARGIPPLPTLLGLLTIELCRQFSISAFNDYFDRHIDRARPDKPVALGIISPQTAWAAGVLFGIASLLISLPFGPWLTLLTAVGLSGGLLYDAGLKYTLFSWLPFCIAFPTLPLWAWVGVHPSGDFPPRLLWVIPVAAILVLGIHLADTIPDIESDKQAGAQGLAHRLGMSRSLALCWSAFGAAVLLTLVLWPLLGYKPEWYISGLLAGAILILTGIVLHIGRRIALKTMSLLLEMGALVLAVGWVGAILL